MDHKLTGQSPRPSPLVARRARAYAEPLTGPPPPPAALLPPRRTLDFPDEPYVARWVPVPEAPPRNAAERVARAMRRYGFPLAALGLSAAVAALVWAGRPSPLMDDPLPLPPELLAMPRATSVLPPPRALTIETLPAGAMVIVERMPLGPSPVRTPGLAEGVAALAVRVEKAGYRTLDTLLTPAREGQHTRLALVPNTDPARAAAPRVAAPRTAMPVAAAAPVFRSPRAPSAERPVAERPDVRAPQREAVAAATPPRIRAGTAERAPARPPSPSRSEDEREASPRRASSVRTTVEKRPPPAERVESEPRGIVVTPSGAFGTVHVLVRSGPDEGARGDRARRVSTQRVYSADLRAGRRRIRVDHPTLGRWEQEVVVRAGEEQTVIVDVSAWSRGGQ